jgi:hypothetical protein
MCRCFAVDEAGSTGLGRQNWQAIAWNTRGGLPK